jgi:hypothetical protein
MPIKHQVQTVITDGALRISSLTEQEVTGSAMVDELIADAVTNDLVSVMIVASQLKTFFLWSDQDLTVKTNNSGSPQETFNLKANKPVVWIAGMSTSPIAGNVTALYITNASGSAATLRLLAGWDATP